MGNLFWGFSLYGWGILSVLIIIVGLYAMLRRKWKDNRTNEAIRKEHATHEGK